MIQVNHINLICIKIFYNFKIVNKVMNHFNHLQDKYLFSINHLFKIVLVLMDIILQMVLHIKLFNPLVIYQLIKKKENNFKIILLKPLPLDFHLK